MNGRSLQHLLALIAELEAKPVAAGRSFQMKGVFAEFERAMIQERVKAGLARAVARSAKLGRPQISMCKGRQIREARAEGLSIRQIAARCGVSVGIAHRVCSS